MSLLLPASRLRFAISIPIAFRQIFTSSAAGKWKITENEENGTTFVSMKEEATESRKDEDFCSLCTCNVPVNLKYSDVLILEQFMREDGTVLPRQMTGLCKKQQLRLERCVMQAHWAGLFPDRTIPDFDRAGYKRFNRYWNDDMDMYKLREKKEHGTWFYIKRYPTKNNAVNRRKHVMVAPWIILLCGIVYGFPGSLDITRSECPFVQGCSCVAGNPKEVECRNIDTETLSKLAVHYQHLDALTITNWDDSSGVLDLTGFAVLTHLANLTVKTSKLESISLDTRLTKLKILDLSNNRVKDVEQICNISGMIPSLKTLSLTGNSLESLHPCLEEMTIDSLDISKNQIVSLEKVPSTLRHLNVARNLLEKIGMLSDGLVFLDLSHNPIVSVQFPAMPSLISLDMSETKLSQLPHLNATKLKTLRMDRSSLFVVNMNRINSPQLKRISFLEAGKLAFITGMLPSSLSSFVLTGSQITSFPQNFFLKVQHFSELNVRRSPYDCDACVVQWAVPVLDLIRTQVNCSIKPLNDTKCLVGISDTQNEVVWGKFGRDAVIGCGAYGNPPPVVEWWLYRPATYLGSFDPQSNEVSYKDVSAEVLDRFSIQGNALLLHDVNKTTIERYVCIASNSRGNGTKIFKFRLDYSDWYSHNLFESVFWGALAFCVVVCALSFLLNITWILTRKSILWWIQRAERLSRVRKMVEAMEKYRVRQLENLQEKYTRRVQVVRDNYHQQVEQLRMSYALQAERFRDYRAAQMETVTSHLENIRENYQQQLNRVREYGSRRAEHLWESYERQVNRMKAFSLQHRLKLMRQYKVKQRHLNKLLESFNDSHSPDAMRKHEEEVRKALELPEEPAPTDEQHLSRSSSFYSLPEYVLDDNGVLRPSPLVPKTIHFTRNLRSPSSSRKHE